MKQENGEKADRSAQNK